MVFHVRLPVVEICAQPSADFDLKFRRHGHVPGVEEAMEIGSEQEPIADIVALDFAERPDIRRPQDGERTLSGDRALPVIGIGDNDSEGPLADAVARRCRL